MKAIIREAAYADLERIFSWIANDRPHAARGVINLIMDGVERLSGFPRMGHRGSVAGTLEWVVPGQPYTIVYTIDERQDEFAVIGIFHGAQDR